MTPDDQLLRRYAQNRDEAAFAELVGRYVDMVYSIALRLTYGDAHLAQEVSQSVFTDLARKAGPLSGRATLSGWLHTSVRYAAHKALRGERRRRVHEQEAFTMQNQPTTPEAPWEQLRQLLDEAIGALREQDRDIVTLRFFQNKSHREVGDALGLGEEAARKRVDRALEKLRAHFARRGVVISAGVLAAEIGANSVQAAPVGLAESLTGISLSAVGVTAESIFLKIIFMNTKITLLCISAAVVGLTWWCWRVAAPDLPVSTAPVQTHAKSVAASLSFQTPSPKGAATTSQSAGLNVPAISNPAAPGKTSATMTGSATPIANADSPASHLAEIPLPAEVHLTVPLEKAEHEMFTSLGSLYPLDVSIVSYRRITSGPRQGEETVGYHIWSGLGPVGSSGGDVPAKPFDAFSPEEQDKIRNWAQQQAAASPAATIPVNTPTSPPVKRSIVPSSSATTPANAPTFP